VLQKRLGNVLAAPAESVVFRRVPPARMLPEEFCEFERLVGHNATLLAARLPIRITAAGKHWSFQMKVFGDLFERNLQPGSA